MINSIYVQNLKGFDRFSLDFDATNILVGPNNSGKSTLLGALRLAEEALNAMIHTKRYWCTFSTDDAEVEGVDLPDSFNSFPYKSCKRNNTNNKTIIGVNFKSGYNLVINISDDHGYTAVLYDDDDIDVGIKRIKDVLLPNIICFGELSLFPPREQVLSEKYLKSMTVRDIRPYHFRNYWYNFDDSFDKFAKLVRESWDSSVSVRKPHKKTVVEDGITNTYLEMNFYEGSHRREIAWAGHGFQIWLQMISALTRSVNAGVLVMDEPDAYLHPAMQNKLMDIAFDLNVQVILATHSLEIINKADPTDIIQVKRGRRKSQRLVDHRQIESLLNSIGVTVNINLYNAIHLGKLLFVEGKDFNYICQYYSAATGHPKPRRDRDIAIQSTGGRGGSNQLDHIETHTELLSSKKVKYYSVFDSDYFCDDENELFKTHINDEGVSVWVLPVKEIENYMINSKAIHKALTKKGSEVLESEIEDLIDSILEEYFDECDTNYMSFYLKHHKKERRGIDESTLIKEHKLSFNNKWNTNKAALVPGKEVIKHIRCDIKKKYMIDVSNSDIITNLLISDIEPLVEIVESILD